MHTQSKIVDIFSRNLEKIFIQINIHWIFIQKDKYKCHQY